MLLSTINEFSLWFMPETSSGMRDIARKCACLIASLSVPEGRYFQKGGKQGIHTEHMGFILADLQYMQRAHPNLKW